MIVAKTKMKEMPKSCRQCEIKVLGDKIVGCPVLHDWLEDWEIEKGKIKLEKCPLEEHNA